MWGWLNRRKSIRRDEDLRERMEKAIEEKHQASLDALEKLKQYRLERRFHAMPVEFERRKA